MFDDKTVKNRRMNKYEMEHEKDVAKAFCRPPKKFLLDVPYYPWVDIPEPLVNFHLRYNFDE